MKNMQINKQISKFSNKQSLILHEFRVKKSLSLANTRNKDIHERIYRFIIRVLNLLKELPKNPENLVFIEQTTRSVTSMGANDQEADAAESKRDFLSKYGLVKKENKETNYWLRLIYDRNLIFQKRMGDLKKEGQEILMVVSKIIINTKNC